MASLPGWTGCATSPSSHLGRHLPRSGRLWLDGVVLNTTETTSLHSATNVFITRSRLVKNGTCGLDYLNPAPTTIHLIRREHLLPMSDVNIQTHTVLGNLRDTMIPAVTGTTPLFVLHHGLAPQDSVNPILAFNKLFYMRNATGTPVNWWRPDNVYGTQGAAIVQNIIEANVSRSATGQPVLALAWGSFTTPSQQPGQQRHSVAQHAGRKPVESR